MKLHQIPDHVTIMHRQVKVTCTTSTSCGLLAIQISFVNNSPPPSTNPITSELCNCCHFWKKKNPLTQLSHTHTHTHSLSFSSFSVVVVFLQPHILGTCFLSWSPLQSMPVQDFKLSPLSLVSPCWDTETRLGVWAVQAHHHNKHTERSVRHCMRKHQSAGHRELFSPIATVSGFEASQSTALIFAAAVNTLFPNSRIAVFQSPNRFTVLANTDYHAFGLSSLHIESKTCQNNQFHVDVRASLSQTRQQGQEWVHRTSEKCRRRWPSVHLSHKPVPHNSHVILFQGHYWEISSQMGGVHVTCAFPKMKIPVELNSHTLQSFTPTVCERPSLNKSIYNRGGELLEVLLLC